MDDDEDPPAPPHADLANPAGCVGADAGRLCLGCHSTGYSVSRRRFAEPGVACEACHGPGAGHAGSKGAKGGIVNPAALPRDRANMVCGQCHSLGSDPSGACPFPAVERGGALGAFRPGDDLAAAFVDARPKLVRKGWEYSLLAGADKRYAAQRCTTCHDPHGRPGRKAMLKDASNEMCFRCHAPTPRARLRYRNHWGLGDATTKPCWKCHQNTHDH